jgi:arylsulfatase A-like enzyme
MPPPGYNILFIFVDQEHFFEKWAFPVPGREYLTKNSTSFANHQSASQVCSSARSTVYTGQHIPHTGVFDNMELPWQPNMSTDVVTIGHRLQQVGYHAAYQGKWHLSANLDAAHQPVDASLLKNREILESYGFVDFLGVGDLIDGPLGGYSYAKEPPAEKIKKLVTMQPDWRNRGAIRSIFDGRYRFSRYFSPIDFNRPTTYEDLVAKNDLEVYDHQEDPQETRNLAQDGKAKAELMMALNATLNGRIDEEIGETTASSCRSGMALGTRRRFDHMLAGRGSPRRATALGREPIEPRTVE